MNVLAANLNSAIEHVRSRSSMLQKQQQLRSDLLVIVAVKSCGCKWKHDILLHGST